MICRSCSSANTEMVLDLSSQPHCNRLIAPGEPDPPSHPLRLWFCHDCTLVQIDHTIPKEAMFSGAYPYVSGTTATLVEHFRQSAARLSAAYLKPGDLVVDIGSNDGTWLRQYAAEIDVLGVEPSDVLAAVPTVRAFFDESIADNVRYLQGPAKLITAAGVFFHLEDLHGVIRGVKKLLADDGVFVVQAIYLGGMVKGGAWDQIYHEHLCYYTLRSLARLLEPYGLTIFDARLLPIHGGTLEVHIDRDLRPVCDGALKLVVDERFAGLGEFETYLEFANRFTASRSELRTLLYRMWRDGETVYAYGAPAKGATLLNSCDISRELVGYAVEKNSLKFGKMIPGCRIPIIDEATAERPDVYLLLAWNFRDEILAKEADFLANGGRFVIPFPRLEVIGGAGSLAGITNRPGAACVVPAP